MSMTTSSATREKREGVIRAKPRPLEDFGAERSQGLTLYAIGKKRKL